MGMKPVKNRNRSIFEEVGAETPKQRPVAPKGGMIDSRPKGARGALRLWIASLVLLALLLLGLDAAAGLDLAPVALAQPFAGAVLFGLWLLGMLGFAASRRFPPGWAGRSLGLGALCLTALLSDPVVFSQTASVARGQIPVPVALSPVLPETAGAGQTAPQTPPAVEPAAPGPAAWLETAWGGVAQGADWLAAQITTMVAALGAPVLATLRAGIGFALSGFGIWYALLLSRTEAELISARRQAEPKLFGLATGVMHFAYLQLLLGALVTALGAGAVFADWPLMAGGVLPPEPLALEPVWRNFIENQGLVQFMHRVAGYLLLILALVAIWRSRRSVHGVTRTAFALLGVWIVLQAGLGIAALVQGGPVELRLAHLAGAGVLWAFILNARFLARYPRVQSIRGIK